MASTRSANDWANFKAMDGSTLVCYGQNRFMRVRIRPAGSDYKHQWRKKLESAELRDGIAQYTSECNSQRRAQSAQSGKRTSSWSRLGFAYDGKDAYMTSYRNEMKNHALETAARKQQAATIRLMQADKTKKAYRPQFSAAMGLGYGRRHAAYRNYFAILRDVPVGVPEESPGSRSRRQSQGSRAPDNNNNMPPVVGVGQMPRPQSVPRGGARSRPRTGSPAAQAN